MISASLGQKPSLPSLGHRSFPKIDSPTLPSSGQGPLLQKHTEVPAQSWLACDPPARGLSVHISPSRSDLPHHNRSAVPATTVCTLFRAQVRSLASRVSPPGEQLPLQGTPQPGRAGAGPGAGLRVSPQVTLQTLRSLGLAPGTREGPMPQGSSISLGQGLFRSPSERPGKQADFKPGYLPRRGAVVSAGPRQRVGIRYKSSSVLAARLPSCPRSPLWGPDVQAPAVPAAPLVFLACAPLGKAVHTALLAGSGSFCLCVVRVVTVIKPPATWPQCLARMVVTTPMARAGAPEMSGGYCPRARLQGWA